MKKLMLNVLFIGFLLSTNAFAETCSLVNTTTSGYNKSSIENIDVASSEDCKIAASEKGNKSGKSVAWYVLINNQAYNGKIFNANNSTGKDCTIKVTMYNGKKTVSAVRIGTVQVDDLIILSETTDKTDTLEQCKLKALAVAKVNSDKGVSYEYKDGWGFGFGNTEGIALSNGKTISLN